MSPANSSNEKRLHFCVLFSSLDDVCRLGLWSGITERAKKKNIQLTAFFGTCQVKTSDYDFTLPLLNSIESIKTSKSFDGLLLLSGLIAHNVGVDAFEKIAAKLPKRMPTVSVSYILPDIPSVLIDNTVGMSSTVEHLIQAHGKERIAFVRGPDGHSEAESRFEGYKKALYDNGIAFDENLVCAGNFDETSGKEAVKELLDVRKLSVDAIAAANDDTALGVISELKTRKILVPSDIAVTGFDDLSASSTNIPQISTSHQDFFELGQVSVDVLHDKVLRKSVEDVKHVKPVFIARQSCGCFKKYFPVSEICDVDTKNETDPFLSFLLQKFALLFPNDIPQKQMQKWAKDLVGTIREKPFSRKRFLSLIDSTLIHYNHYSDNYTAWHDAFHVLSVGVETYSDEIESISLVQSTLIYATTLINEMTLNEQIIQENALYETQTHARRVANDLSLLFDFDNLAKQLHDLLPTISINTAFVGLYSNAVKSADIGADRKVCTVVGFDGEKVFCINQNKGKPILFSDYSTITGFDIDRELRALLHLPLYFNEEEVGVLLLPFIDKIPIDVYEILRINTANDIKGSQLLTSISALSITDDLTGLLNRRGFLQFVHSRLVHLARSNDLIPIVMFIDMDGLKSINDNYGHDEGDIALSVFSRLIKESLREEDIIGRMGGDEFVIFSSVKSRRNSDALVKRIREHFDEYNSKGLHPYKIVGSIGSVALDNSTKECFEAALLLADSILYEEKKAKNLVAATSQKK